ncbi:hypothetical protein LTR84_011892 [Exophiala bonariae]|uniref:Gfo/Idh/MocA-like oxidoreductase N-terminal domain-containing protein n=1 Tax=Exophiala bonariae TaxID=1690606 RepID=A0AAV9NJQ1_9EURO|nr:hypothetical protein LTR84_011892 [Exophiala bonariae]
MAPIKVGFIGASAGSGLFVRSWAAKAHIPYLVQTPNYTITAMQNSSQASAERAIQDHKIPGEIATYGDPESLAADPNVDLVAVSVKVPLHSRLLRPALEAGKDVFVEWPLAANLKEAEELTALAKSKSVKTIVGLQARQDSSIRKAREMVQSGELGQIISTTMKGAGGIFNASLGTSYEYLLPIENGANMVTIPAGHAIDALCYVVGEFRDLQATLANNIPKIQIVDGEGNILRTVDKTSHDWMSVSGNLVNGGVANVVYEGGSSLTGKSFCWEIVGTKGALVLEGPHGHVQMFHPTLKIVRAGDKEAKLEEIKVEISSKPMDFTFNTGKAWDAFVGQGDGSWTTFEDAVVRHKMIDAIYRSNESGRRESYI